jgi:hypothetical protein
MLLWGRFATATAMALESTLSSRLQAAPTRGRFHHHKPQMKQINADFFYWHIQPGIARNRHSRAGLAVLLCFTVATLCLRIVGWGELANPINNPG